MAKRAAPPGPASRAWTDVEIDALDLAWLKRDDEALARLGNTLGVTLAIDQLAKLERGQYRSLDRRTILHALSDAMSADHGIGMRDEQSYASAKFCVAAIVDGTLYAATGDSGNIGDSPAQAWSSLKPWYRDLRKNRPKLAGWLAQTPVRFEAAITAAPPSLVTDDTLALRQAIAASPDDDEPRRVLGDLLLERGDAHGELIALQLSPTPDTTRIAALLLELSEKVAGDIHAHATKYTIRRGFVESVTMSGAKFATHGERLFRDHPIRELKLRPLRTPALAKVGTTPALSRVRALTLDHEDQTPVETSLVPLLGSPHLTGLEELRIASVIAPDWAEAFAALRAPRLRLVDIAHGRFEWPSLIALLANTALPPFALVLSSWKHPHWVSPGAASVTAIAEALGSGRVTSLTLVERASIFTPADWTKMFSATSAIEALAVRGELFNEASLAGVAAGQPTLRSFTCTLSNVEASGLARFLGSPAGSKIERLFPWTTRIRGAALHDSLVRIPASHPLRYVAGFAHGTRFVDANLTDHPDAARRYWHPI